VTVNVPEAADVPTKAGEIAGYAILGVGCLALVGFLVSNMMGRSKASAKRPAMTPTPSSPDNTQGNGLPLKPGKAEAKTAAAASAKTDNKEEKPDFNDWCVGESEQESHFKICFSARLSNRFMVFYSLSVVA
jgi:hypothetical protein